MILTFVVLVHVLIQVRRLPRSMRRCRGRRLGPMLAGASRRSHGNAVIRLHTDSHANSNLLAHRRRSTAAARQHRRVHLLALGRPAETQARRVFSRSPSRRSQNDAPSSRTPGGSLLSAFGAHVLSIPTHLAHIKLKRRRRRHSVSKVIQYHRLITLWMLLGSILQLSTYIRHLRRRDCFR